MVKLFSRKNACLISFFFLLGLFFVYLLKDQFHINTVGTYGTVYCIAVVFILRYETGSYFSPVTVFFYFYWLILLGRPFLANLNILDTEVVEASSSTAGVLFQVDFYIVTTIIFIGFIYFLIGIFHSSIFDFFSIPAIKISSRFRVALYIILCISGIILLMEARIAYNAIKESGYIALVETEEIVYFNQTYYTLLKWSWFFLFVSHFKNWQVVFITFLFLLFLTALPLSGLRGYFILYILIAITMFEARKIFRLKLSIIIPLIIGLLTAVTMMLEYRLGFSITNGGAFSPAIKAVFDQGSTYEVVYGAVEFRDKLDFYQNVMFPSFFGNPVFGVTVDRLRGIQFANDVGFATSAFAEIVTGGIIGWIMYTSFLAFVLNILNRAFLKVKESNANYFTIFFLAPVVWGQPRGALLQLVFKFVFFILLIIVFKGYRTPAFKRWLRHES